MARFLLAPLIVFAVLAGWIWVQRTYARFASRHPDLGPFRSEDGGCSCGNGQCEKRPSPVPVALQDGAGGRGRITES